MIIRRAARFGSKIGLHEPFLAAVAEKVIAGYSDFYPELAKNRAAILDNLTREEKRFARTVEGGMARLEQIIRDLAPKTIIPGDQAFDLYATYGLPLELTRDVAREQGLEVDEAGFRAAMEEHRLASGGGKAMGAMGGEDAEFFSGLLYNLQAKGKLPKSGVAYDPYTLTSAEGEVLALIVEGQLVSEAQFGDQVEVILPQTGFYLESGGQVADSGVIRSISLPLNAENLGGDGGGWEIEISQARRPAAGVIVHQGEVVSGKPKVGDRAAAFVDAARRHDIMRNHTATHLMHAALHAVLGEHARQAGSLVAPDRLRFDFNHPEAMTPEQIERVESLVNAAIAADMPVSPRVKSREQAIAEGAMALFGEKYGEEVRTITIGDPDDKHSYELCGGTHLERTSDVGVFVIVSEGSAAAGVRRIEAVTGRGAHELIARRSKALKTIAAALKVGLEETPQKVDALQDELSAARKQIAALRTELALSTFEAQLANTQPVGAVNLLVVEAPGVDRDSLSKLADKFRERFPANGVCVVASRGEAVTVMAAVTQDLIKQGLKAGDLVGHISRQLGAGGGGAPHLAFGGGKDAGKLAEALGSVPAWVQEKLKK
jgi:alanyl-tRNA synthetase